MRSLIVTLIMLSPGVVLAQDGHRFPMELPASGQQPYVTAYKDQAAGGGVADWQCGGRSYNGHRGTDYGIGGFPVMDAGSRWVVASRDGIVVSVTDGCYDRCTGGCWCGGGFGNHVRIQHADGTITIYGHMMKSSLQVALHDTVTCGQRIGKVGSSGNSSGPHLHFEPRAANNVAFDPYAGRCGSAESSWTEQGAYLALPGQTCDGNVPDSAIVVAETLAQGATVLAGSSVTQTWTVKNTGTDTWSAGNGYAVTFDSGDQLGATATVELPPGTTVPWGQEVDFSITFSAPSSEGEYAGTWRMTHAGMPFGQPMVVSIDVQEPVDDANFVSETVPDGTQVVAGTTFVKTWTLRNGGDSTWTAADGFALRYDRGERFDGPAEVTPIRPVAPDDTYEWSLSLTAPETPGLYRGYWRMTDDGDPFGTNLWVEVRVVAAVDDAQFVTETVPDGTDVPVGQPFVKTWTVRNDGNTTWTADADYTFVFDGGDQMSGPGDVLLAPSDAVAPGETHVWSIDLVAPQSPGRYRGYWRMKKDGVLFGDRIWVEIDAG